MEEDMKSNEVKASEDMEQEDVMTIEEIAEHADDKVDALVRLLIKKKIIVEEEFEKEYEALFEEEGEETTE